MKKIAIIVLAFIVSLPAYSQDDVISKYFKRYLDDENFTKVTVTSRMFSLFTDIQAGDEDEEEFLEAIGKLEGLKVISSDSIENGMAKYKDALKTVQGKGYEALMSVQDGDGNFEFMIKEEGKTITELLMVAGGDSQFHLITLYGDIDLRSITKVASKMNIGALDHLKKLDSKGEGNN